MFYPNYLECDVKTKVKRVGEGDMVRYIPDLPIERQPYTLVFCDGVNYYGYPLPASTEGKDCICHVVYHAEDDKVMKDFIGKIGVGNEVTKMTDYKAIVQKTVADIKIAEEKSRLTFEADKLGQEVSQETLNAVEYKEIDANDGYPVWAFLQKDYEDK